LDEDLGSIYCINGTVTGNRLLAVCCAKQMHESGFLYRRQKTCRVAIIATACSDNHYKRAGDRALDAVSVVPEPGGCVLPSFGAGVLLIRRRRSRT
jgi:hypothetical protein